MRVHRQASGKSKTQQTPHTYWMDMIPQKRVDYDGRWSPHQVAEYFSTNSQDRFTPARDIMEAVKAKFSFADDWRRELKQQPLEACWKTIDKVYVNNASGGASGKAPGLDGHKASTGR